MMWESFFEIQVLSASKFCFSFHFWIQMVYYFFPAEVPLLLLLFSLEIFDGRHQCGQKNTRTPLAHMLFLPVCVCVCLVGGWGGGLWQSHTEGVTYLQAVREVIKADGLVGLFGRGLQTKIIANGMQGLMFSVLWKAIEEKLNKWRNDWSMDSLIHSFIGFWSLFSIMQLFRVLFFLLTVEWGGGVFLRFVLFLWSFILRTRGTQSSSSSSDSNVYFSLKGFKRREREEAGTDGIIWLGGRVFFPLRQCLQENYVGTPMLTTLFLQWKRRGMAVCLWERG